MLELEIKFFGTLLIVSDYLFIKSQTSIIQTKTSYCSDSFFFINGNKKEVPDFCCFTSIVIHFIPPSMYWARN